MMFSSFKDLPMSSFFNAVLNFFLAIILPVQVYLLLIGGVILLDCWYGYMKAKKQSNIGFDAFLLLRGIRNKMAIYTPAMVGVYWLDFHLLNEFLMAVITVPMVVTKVGCIILMSTEIASINRNIKVITGKSLKQRIKESMDFAKDVNEDIKDLKD